MKSRSTLVVLAAGLCGAAGIVAAVSCIPDLPSASPASDGGLADQGAAEAAAPRCGDGIIQLEAGEQCDPGPAAGDAGANGCGADCRMQCEGGFLWPRNNHCYTQETAEESVNAAMFKCGVRKVVTFASDDEQAAVSGGVDAGSFWVGFQPMAGNGYLSEAAFEPGWSPTCSGCFAHTLDPTRPLPGDGGGCVRGFADANRSWDQVACADGGYRRVICEREPAGRLSTECEAGTCLDLVWTFGSKRYLYVRAPLSAGGAELDCQSKGGTLVVLQSRDEREQLWQELARMQGVAVPTGIWIGLSSVTDAGSPDAASWVWDDGAELDAYPSPWGDGLPAGELTRAYLYQSAPPPQRLDDTLAHNDKLTIRVGATAVATLAYVCQFTP